MAQSDQAGSRRTVAIWRALYRVLSSTWLGLAILGLLFAYMAFGSITPSPNTSTASWPFMVWPLKALMAALLVNMTLATSRIRLSLPWLGAWAAHLGVLVLAGGAVWYIVHSISGYAYTWKDDLTQHFQPMERFYVNDAFCLYGQVDPAGAALEGPLNPQPTLERDFFDHNQGVQDVSATLTGLPPGVGGRATRFAQAARLSYEWSDGGPVDAPGVKILLQDGPHRMPYVLAPNYGFARRLIFRGYSIRYSPSAEDEQTVADTATRGGIDAVVISGAKSLPGRILIFRANGSKEELPLVVGAEMELSLAGRTVKLTVQDFLLRAWRRGVAKPVRLGEAPAALEVEIAVDQWRQKQWIKYETIVRPVAPDDADITSLPLPEGRWLYLQCAPLSKPLPHIISISEYRYETSPGSGTPRDFYCKIDVQDEAGQVVSQQDCRLNRPARVGKLLLYQGSWLPNGEEVQAIVLLVRSKEGLGAVWTGCIIIGLAIPYAFYVKPLLLRRSRRTA